uniref:Lateral signaling target protein 2 homolog n=1 Tax=Saccoglossus kowalevskii TaxID=10224 RepID=A0ABM0MR83_SACKO|nr:PREDICTED: lateral signaling target protein 2 homolog [Saccoglossus kowalevskii]
METESEEFVAHGIYNTEPTEYQEVAMKTETNQQEISDSYSVDGMIKKSDTVLFKASGSDIAVAETSEHYEYFPLKGHDSDLSSPDSPLIDEKDENINVDKLMIEECADNKVHLGPGFPIVGKSMNTVEVSQAGTEVNTADCIVGGGERVRHRSHSGNSGCYYDGRMIEESIFTQEGSFMGTFDHSTERCNVENGYDWESDESSSSTETSSYTSECQDESEITMAIQAAELAAKQQARAHFSSAGDLIHRLFVCISGVADQLQTNFAADLRNILKSVFEVCTSESYNMEDSDVFCNGGASGNIADQGTGRTHSGNNGQRRARRSRHPSGQYEEPPAWVPDENCTYCTSCKVPFTVIRRKHHCRNCGKIFCGRCSTNSVPLPRYGVIKPVRVCTKCYMFCVTPFLR